MIKLSDSEKLRFLGFIEESEIDAWDDIEECDPNPSDAFEQGARSYRLQLTERIKKEFN